VGSVASVFMSRWDVAVADRVPDDLKDRLALAVGMKTYAAYRSLLDSDRFQRFANSGARAQRLLWASTSTKDPAASDTLYVHGLGAPFTINTIPSETLQAFADHGEVGDPLPADGGDADERLARFTAAGIDLDALARDLQTKGAESFVSSWNDLLAVIEKASSAVT
jgi:transaldolase